MPVTVLDIGMIACAREAVLFFTHDIYMLTNEDIARIGVEMARVIEDNIDPRFDAVEHRLDGVEGRLGRVEGRLDGVEGRLGGVESAMVTKSYLDDKLADLRGEFHLRQRGAF